VQSFIIDASEENIANERQRAEKTLAFSAELAGMAGWAMGCELLGLKVENVALNGYGVDRATVRQRKTDPPVKFELTE
jgi:hypothetical protein